MQKALLSTLLVVGGFTLFNQSPSVLIGLSTAGTAEPHNPPNTQAPAEPHHSFAKLKSDNRPAEPSASRAALPVENFFADMLRPVPATARLWRHPLAASDDSSPARGTHHPEKLVYQNASDELVLVPGPGRRIADDIYTEMVEPCGLDRFITRVAGVVPESQGGGEGTFDVTISLMDRCPNLLPFNAPAIPGTEYRFRGLSDLEGDITDLEFDFAHGLMKIGGAEFPLGICENEKACRIDAQDCADGSQCVPGPVPQVPPHCWLRLEFHSNKGGWLSGDPATRGFTGDLFSDILFGCNAYYGGFPRQPHASFYAEAFVDGSLSETENEAVCPTHFLAYRASDPYVLACTENSPCIETPYLGDDVEMIVDECELSAIEIETKGSAGEYEIEISVRNRPTDDPLLDPDGQPLTWTFQSRSDQQGGGRGQLEVARRTFTPGVLINQRTFWITWRANKPNTGVINVQRARAGGENLCTFFPGLGELPKTLHCNHFYWGPAFFENWFIETPDKRDAIFSAAVYCRGEPPRGACCTGQPDEPGAQPSCIDDDGEGNAVTVLECENGRWLQDVTCPSGFGYCEGDGEPAGTLCETDIDCRVGGTCSTPIDQDPWYQAGQPRCGAHACCKPDGTCEDLPRDQCVAISDDLGRPSVWFAERFCFEGDFECPWFDCHHATNDCTVSAGDPFFECGADSDCDQFDEVQFDSACVFYSGLGRAYCTIQQGCGVVSCCDFVCDADPFCCETGWDQQCADESFDCPDPPVNDNCWDVRGSYFGAREIELASSDCQAGAALCGYANANLESATIEAEEPGFCCHKEEPDAAAVATVWYKFRAAQSGSARISTCNSPDAPGNQDSIIQVFRVDDEHAGVCDNDEGACEGTGESCNVAAQDCPADARCIPSTACFYSGPGTLCPDNSACVLDERTVCQDLTVKGCNDDGGDECGDLGGRSQVCVTGLNAGELYYIQLGVDAHMHAGHYRIDVEQPCPIPPPSHTFCEGALPAQDGTEFDLEGHTLECPIEACVPNMQNDAWFETVADCVGNLIVETCGRLEDDPDPDTTLVVYRGADCPPGEPLACNDDAVVDAENHQLRPQWCQFAQTPCDRNADCPGGSCSIGGTPCTLDTDCHVGTCEISGGTCQVYRSGCPLGLCGGVGPECTNFGQPCPGGTQCKREDCLLDEVCLSDTCVSSCGKASAVVVPAFQGETYKIRVGGFQGSAPTGELTISCRTEDCNNNIQPDAYDISDQCEASCSTDLNFNDVPDECDINNGQCSNGEICFVPSPVCADGSECVAPSQDCNDNGIPDEAEIFIGSTCGPGPFFCLADCAEDLNNNCVPDECDVECPVPGVDGPAIGWTPDDGTVDARQPRLLDDATYTLGIGGDAANAITVVAPSGADPSCWSMCETQLEGTANDIESVVDNNDDTYTITLQRPITAGAVTEITYTDSDGLRHTASYTSLPADSDGSELVERADVDFHVDCCLDASCSPYGVYSCDINYSAAVTVEDLARLVDLLNNAGDFTRPWEGQTPDLTLDCPE